MKIEIHYVKLNDKDKCPMINIDGDDFNYSNIFNMYQDNKSGHGIQVSEPSKEKPLMDMCDTIADAVHLYQSSLTD